jgi:hypothetical protein
MRRRCATPLVAGWLFAFFFTSSLRLREDGSGKMVVVYPAAPITTQEIEVRRFTSAVSKATAVRIDRGIAQVRIVFDDINRLTEAPEFANSTLALATGDDGVARFSAVLRSRVLGDVTSDAAATVRLALPGPLVASNGRASAGNRAVFSAPVRQFFSPDGLPIEASYRLEGAPARDGGGS